MVMPALPIGQDERMKQERSAPTRRQDGGGSGEEASWLKEGAKRGPPVHSLARPLQSSASIQPLIQEAEPIAGERRSGQVYLRCLGNQRQPPARQDAAHGGRVESLDSGSKPDNLF